jgi:hypothetical protein
VEQVEEVTQGLQRLDYYLMNVTNEQRYLYARTVRHLRTAESTYGRTLGYMLLICGTIVLASFVQVSYRQAIPLSSSVRLIVALHAGRPFEGQPRPFASRAASSWSGII